MVAHIFHGVLTGSYRYTTLTDVTHQLLLMGVVDQLVSMFIVDQLIVS